MPLGQHCPLQVHVHEAREPGFGGPVGQQLLQLLPRQGLCGVCSVGWPQGGGEGLQGEDERGIGNGAAERETSSGVNLQDARSEAGAGQLLGYTRPVIHHLM